MIFARANLVNVLNRFHCEREPRSRPRESGSRGGAGGGDRQDHQQHVPLFSRDPRKISAVIDTNIAAATAESVRFIYPIQSHCAVRRKACRDV